MNPFLRLLNDDLAALAARARQGIVQVHNDRYGAGTGIIVRADGLILTNAHVVRRRDLRVTFRDGRTLRARVMAYERGADLAVLRVAADDLPALALGSSGALRAGDLVLAVGHPWGVPGAATIGAVVARGVAGLPPAVAGRTWVVTDAHLRPGHSGGPLLNTDGAVVGVNTMIVSADLGLAVPSDVVRDVLRRPLAAGRATV